MTPLAPDSSLRAQVEAGKTEVVHDACLSLFVRANAGTDITPQLPGLLGLLGTSSGDLALPSLSLVALQKRELILESIRAMGVAPGWHLSEGSVLLPAARFGWEPTRGGKPPAGFSNTFRVEVENGFLGWYERNFLLRQPFDAFLGQGPPPPYSTPDDVKAKLRGIVGGPAGENRVSARERYLARLKAAPPSAACETCASLAGGASADLRAREDLPAAARALIVIAVTWGAELRRCAGCGAHFHFENDYEFGYWDTDHLRPVSVTEAVAYLTKAYVVA